MKSGFEKRFEMQMHFEALFQMAETLRCGTCAALQQRNRIFSILDIASYMYYNYSDI